MLKNALRTATVLAVAAIIAAGCSEAGSTNEPGGTSASETASEGSSVNVLANLDPFEYVEVPEDLTKIKYRLEGVTEVTEEAIDQEMEIYRRYTMVLEEVEDRDLVEEGDVVNIDFVGRIDGEPFDGGTESDYNLEIGEGYYLEGFEDGLIGAKKGDTVEVTSKFPKEYFVEDLAGREAVFQVTVNKIQRYTAPEFTDEVVAGIGLTDFDGNPIETIAELRAYIEQYLLDRAEYYEAYDMEEEAIKGLLASTTVKKDFTEEMLEEAVDRMLVMEGLDRDTASREEREYLKAYAKEYLKEFLAVLAVAKNENITASKEDALDYIRLTMKENAESFIESASEEEIQNYIYFALRKKVADRVIEKGTNVYADRQE